MPEIRHLNNAPAVEAVIDFRAELPEGFSISDFSTAKNTLREQYPKVEEMVRKTLSIQLDQKSIASAIDDQGSIGLKFTSGDEKNIAQFRRDGFTFSRLSPYTSWDEISAEAFRLWEIYSNISSSDFITRIAVRYINRIEIPIKISDLSDYFTAPPTLPSEVSMSIRSFLARFSVQDASHGILANIILATYDRAATETHIPIILDIDVYKAQKFYLNQLTEIKETFAILREFKNRIFFESMTERAIRTFE